MSQELAEILEKGITTLNLSVSANTQQQLLQYLELLFKWNKVYNLTSVRNKKQIVSHHLLDSLAICPYINGANIADIGTGAGLPGIVLALCFPEQQFTLIDSNSKKTRFINQAVTELKLSNVQVQHSRVEDLQCETSFDQIISRAYTSLKAFVTSTSHLASIKTQFLGMKGQIPEDEIAQLGEAYAIECFPLNVPNVEGQRHLIKMASK